MLPDPKFTSQKSPHLVAVLKKPIMDRIGQPHNTTAKPGSLMKYILCNMKSLFIARGSLHCNYAGKSVNMEVVELLTRMLLDSFLRPLNYSFTRISLQVRDELFEQYALWAIDFGGPCRIRTKETPRVRGESTPRTCHYQQVPVHTRVGEDDFGRHCQWKAVPWAIPRLEVHFPRAELCRRKLKDCHHSNIQSFKLLCNGDAKRTKICTACQVHSKQCCHQRKCFRRTASLTTRYSAIEDEHSATKL